MKRKLVIFLLINSVLLCWAASLIDNRGEPRDEPRADNNQSKQNCLCNGASCICCVDFNMPFIELGGPGCIRMNYISPEDGISLNVSFGDILLQSDTVKGPKPEPTCLNIFTQIAQMCARFNELLPTDDGLRGCVDLEPMILGTAQLQLHMGCFEMGPKGMKIIESPLTQIKDSLESLKDSGITENGTDTETGTTNLEDETIAGISTADILEAVSDSAKDGIEIIKNWLGLDGPPINQTISNTTTLINE